MPSRGSCLTTLVVELVSTTGRRADDVDGPSSRAWLPHGNASGNWSQSLTGRVARPVTSSEASWSCRDRYLDRADIGRPGTEHEVLATTGSAGVQRVDGDIVPAIERLSWMTSSWCSGRRGGGLEAAVHMNHRWGSRPRESSPRVLRTVPIVRTPSLNVCWRSASHARSVDPLHRGCRRREVFVCSSRSRPRQDRPQRGVPGHGQQEPQEAELEAAAEEVLLVGNGTIPAVLGGARQASAPHQARARVVLPVGGGA